MPIFALADCNNFFASCERAFNPKLENKPVVVLSNNDGCIISRSNEAKEFLPMGAPLFKYKKICEEKGVIILSSNFQLYGNMSNRVMEGFKELVPEVEIYSIDEAFFRLDKIANIDLAKYNEFVRSKIKQWTGIPISIGIGPTKVLAKIANHIAKKSNKGVFDIRDVKLQDSILKKLDIGEVWGIGTRKALHLRQLGIINAYQLKNADNKFIRKIFGLVGERVVLELRGLACFEWETIPELRKNICIARSFGRPVTELRELEEAIADYAVRACEKMRVQGSKARGVNIFIQTYWYDSRREYYGNGNTYWFESPTDDTNLIMKRAKSLLKSLFKSGLSYKKVGVVLLNLCDKNYSQGDLFLVKDDPKKEPMINVIDAINKKIGKRTVFFGAQGTTREWRMRCDNRSPRYTTNWEELPIAY